MRHLRNRVQSISGIRLDSRTIALSLDLNWTVCTFIGCVEGSSSAWEVAVPMHNIHIDANGYF
jgi:hypothetical protein